MAVRVVERTIWSDLHPELKIGADGQPTIVKNVQAVYASLENIMMTVIGSRCMLRSFATNFYTMLFEPIIEDVLRVQYIDTFKKAIQQWESRVKIQYLDFQTDRDDQTVKIRMEMYIIGYEQVFTYEKVFKAGD